MKNKISSNLVFRFFVALIMAIFILCLSWGQAVPSSVFGNSSIQNVIWGNGKFVAVGSNASGVIHLFYRD
ncbi:MAG: hypothetical protein LBU85_01515 [Treponema sp.]|jgi:hypothetical protein|nr:hypothetical protein [Treponema sp.]